MAEYTFHVKLKATSGEFIAQFRAARDAMSSANREIRDAESEIKRLNRVLNDLERNNGFGSFQNQVKSFMNLQLFQQLISQVTQFYNAIGDLAGKFIDFSRSVVEGVAGIGKELLKTNQSWEDQTIGMAAFISSSSELYDPSGKIVTGQDKFNLALIKSKEIMADLQKTAAVSVGETKDYVDIFQKLMIVVSAASPKNTSFEDVVKRNKELTAGIVGAVAAMGNSLVGGSATAIREVQLLLEGQYSIKNRFAQNLGISKEDLAKWKANGNAVEELTKRMKDFKVASDYAGRSVTGIFASFNDFKEIFERTFSADLYQGFETFLRSILDKFVTIKDGVATISPALYESANILREMCQPAVGAITQFVQKLFNFTQTHGEMINNLINVLIAAVQFVFNMMSECLTLADQYEPAINKVLVLVIAMFNYLSKNGITVLKNILVLIGAISGAITGIFVGARGGLPGALIGGGLGALLGGGGTMAALNGMGNYTDNTLNNKDAGYGDASIDNFVKQYGGLDNQSTSSLFKAHAEKVLNYAGYNFKPKTGIYAEQEAAKMRKSIPVSKEGLIEEFKRFISAPGHDKTIPQIDIGNSYSTLGDGRGHAGKNITEIKLTIDGKAKETIRTDASPEQIAMFKKWVEGIEQEQYRRNAVTNSRFLSTPSLYNLGRAL